MSLCINSSTFATLIPPFHFGGSVTDITSSQGATSSPKSASLTVSTAFFLALRISWILGYLGLLSLRSHVKTAGSPTSIIYKPASISLVTHAVLFEISILKAFVA